MTDPVRIVVAEGTASRKGFLRFVLEGEGYDVVGEAANPAELARSVSVHEPDVVVMDDGIGATSVGMIHDLAPAAKVILVWPGAVMPIGGDARVEPSNVLRELGLAVEGLTGVVCATSLAVAAGGALAGPRDAATLRDVLARGEAAQAHRPTEPEPASAAGAKTAGVAAAAAAVAAGAAIASAGADAAAVGGQAASEGVASEGAAAAGTAGAAAAASAPAEVDATATALNRRLGTIALSGAAAAGALVLTLALGGSRVPVASISGAAAEPSSPGIGQPSVTPVEPGGEGNGEGNGGWQGGGGQGDGVVHSRGGTAPCNYYIETCLPPAGLTGTGGLSVGNIYSSLGGGAAAAPGVSRADGREARSRDRKGDAKAKDRKGDGKSKDRKDAKAKGGKARDRASNAA
jgi:DNA-binding NarL/FixJ family response regulator